MTITSRLKSCSMLFGSWKREISPKRTLPKVFSSWKLRCSYQLWKKPSSGCYAPRNSEEGVCSCAATAASWRHASAGHGRLANLPRFASTSATSKAGAYVYDAECEQNKKAFVDLNTSSRSSQKAVMSSLLWNTTMFCTKYRYEITKLLAKHSGTTIKKKEYRKSCTVAYLYGTPGTGKSTIVDILCDLRQKKGILVRRSVVAFVQQWKCNVHRRVYERHNLVHDAEHYHWPASHDCAGQRKPYWYLIYRWDIHRFELQVRRSLRKTDSNIIEAVRRHQPLHALHQPEPGKVNIMFERYNTVTRKLMCTGNITYFLTHTTEEEGRLNAAECCTQNILESDLLSDLFIENKSNIKK